MAMDETTTVDEEVRSEIADDFGSHDESTVTEDAAVADATPEAAASRDDDTDAEPTESVAETTATEVEFSSDVLAKAEFYGYTAEEAREFGTPEALERHLAVVDRRAANEARAAMERGEENQEETPEAATPNSAADGSGAFEKFKLEVNPDEFDAESLKLLNGMNDHYHGAVEKQMAKIAALESQLSQVTGHFQAEAEAKFTSDMDSFFNELPDTFKDVFGKGKLDAIAPKGWHMSNRRKLVEEMNVVADSDRKHGRPLSPPKQLAQRALQLLHGDKLKTIARKEVASEVATRKKQAVARPNSRTTKPLSEDDALRKIAHDWRVDKGLDDES